LCVIWFLSLSRLLSQPSSLADLLSISLARAIHITRLLDYLKSSDIFCPGKLFWAKIPLPKNLFRKIARFLVSKIRPATGVTHSPGQRVKQWRRRRKLFKNKAVSRKVDTNMETVILRFFGGTGGILETQELFPKAYFTHKPTYAYLPLFMGSWNMQEH